MRAHSFISACMTCSMTTSVSPRDSRMRRSVSSICATSVAVRPAITSSSRTIRAPVAMARATSRRFWPARVSVEAGAAASSRHADLVEHGHRVAIGAAAVGERDPAEHGRRAQVLEHASGRGNGLTIWNVRATPRRQIRSGERPSMRWPSSAIVPALGRALPAIRLKSVVLPAPLAPMTPIVSPAETENETPASAVRPPKRLPRSRTSSNGAAALVLTRDGRGAPARCRRCRGCRPARAARSRRGRRRGSACRRAAPAPRALRRR